MRPGGLNRYLDNLQISLRAEGVRSLAVVAGDRDRREEGYLVSTSAATILPMRLLKLWWAAIHSPRTDVLDAHFALYTVGPVLVARARRQPVVVHFQGPWADESLAAGESTMASKVKRSVEALVYRRADTCVVLSGSFADVLHQRYGIPKWAILRIPPGVDLGAFHPGDRALARSRLGLHDDRAIVLAVRRLVPRMGLDVLLEAWAEVVRRSEQPVELIVAGEGPERSRLEVRANRNDLAGTVRFVGRVDDDDLVAYYRAANVSVIPSIALEGFGLVALESMACGIPVVGTATGGLPEVLGPLGEELVVPAGEVDDLADLLLRATSGSLALPSSQACREYAEKFDWHAVGRRHAELYERLRSQTVRVPGPASPTRRRRPRVVVLGHTAALSGGELAMARLLPALRDVDVHVVLATDGPLVGLLKELGVSVELLAMPVLLRDLRKERVGIGQGIAVPAVMGGWYVGKLTRRLRQLRPDLVHTNTLKAALYGGIASKAAGVPCLWHIRDRIEPDYLPVTAVNLVRSCARILPEYVVANSTSTLMSLHLPAGLGEVVPSPVEIGPCRVREGSRPLRIGMLGRLAPWKGQDLFLRAFAEAFPGGLETAVVIGAPLFGDDSFEEELRRLAGELSIEDRVEFRGFRQDVRQELGCLDVLVHASRIPEPFGQVVVEGMAAGLPVVAANAGGPAEIITPELDGLLFTPGDIKGLAVQLGDLAASPARRRSLGLQAQASASLYRPEVVAEKMQGVYARILRSRI